MDERRQERSELLPGASQTFVRGICEGADRIRAYERRRRRAAAMAAAAAAVALVAIGFGAALGRLRAPRPDNVALSVNPHGAAVETEAPDLAPSAEETADAARTPRLTAPTSGWTESLDLITLTGKGPFEAGQWLVLTNEYGELAWGNSVDFFEQPRANSRCVSACVGMMVKYLADAGDGFAEVEFSGQRGYVYAGQLRRGASLPEPEEGAGCVLDEASLYLTGALGNVQYQSVVNADNDVVPAYALQKLLDAVRPADPSAYEGAPFGALLVVRFVNENDRFYENGVEKQTTLAFNMPRDGSFALLTQDGRVYEASEADAKLFWSIFSEIEPKTWGGAAAEREAGAEMQTADH